MRPMGWLVSVKATKALHIELYVTVADTREHAEVLVGDHCNVTNETIKLERTLADGEIERLGLKPGEVKTIRCLTGASFSRRPFLWDTGLNDLDIKMSCRTVMSASGP